MDKKCRVVPPAIILKRRIGLGVDVPLDCREFGKLAGADFVEFTTNVLDDVALLGKQMYRRVVLATIFGKAFERGKAVEREIDFHGRAGAAEIVEFGVEIGREVIWANE